jgi:methyl-accepting chemotaxis protein
MIQKLRNLSVGSKINLGFSINTIILAGAIIAVIILLKKFNIILDQVIHHRMVTVQKTHKLLNGVNQSLASLRGWMLLGEEKFKKERHDVWKEEIIPSEDNLEKLSTDWPDQNNIKLFQAVKDDLLKFKKYQQDIEDIANTSENLPAHKILFEKATPLSKEAIANIAQITNLELSLKATPERKALMVKLGNLEVTFSLILSKVESYLISGDVKYKNRYDKLIAINDERLADLGSKISLFNKEQLTHFQIFEIQRTRFKALTTRTINLRESPEWNKANFYLGSKAAPLANKITNKLEQMLISEKKILLDDELNAEFQIWILKILLAAFLIIGSFIAAVIGTSISKGISEPIKSLNHGLKELTLGNRKLKKLEITSNNEIGELNESFNKLLERIRLWQ